MVADEKKYIQVRIATAMSIPRVGWTDAMVQQQAALKSIDSARNMYSWTAWWDHGIHDILELSVENGRAWHIRSALSGDGW